ncbi:hypothetical protein D3C86_2027210 [compost metagenome]
MECRAFVQISAAAVPRQASRFLQNPDHTSLDLHIIARPDPEIRFPGRIPRIADRSRGGNAFADHVHTPAFNLPLARTDFHQLVPAGSIVAL